MSTIQQQIQAFTCGKETEYTFPAGLGVEERKLVKVTAEKLGLTSRSFGMGKDRQIHIFKPASWMAPAVEPNSSINSESDTGSTVDSESERQDPTISIKNTFVHFVTDNADPRIIQSMPAGSFAANIEAEKKQEETANAGARSQKRRPLALSQISPRTECEEPESETVASLMFPSTPNAENCVNFSTFHNGMTPQGAGQADAVPVVQWIPPARTAPETVTVLPPAHFTPSAPAPLLTPVISETSPAIRTMPPVPQGPAQGWTQELPQAMPQGGPQGPPQEQPQGRLNSPAQGLPQGQPTQPQGSAHLVPGTPVVLQGLANQPDFNGLHGVVNNFDAECGRYNVMIEIGANAHRRLVKVKSHNLKPAQCLAQVPPSSAGQPPCSCCHLPQQPVAAGQSARASLVLSHMV